MTGDRATPRRFTRRPLAAGALVVALVGVLPSAGVAAAVPVPLPSGTEASTSVPLGARPAAGLEPGSVGRTSVDVDATYAVDLAVRYGDRAVRMDSTATITNTSGAPIDRVELNTVAARLGGMSLFRVSVDDRTVTATVSDQTIAVPLGGILAPGGTTKVRVIYHATLRTNTADSAWFFTRADGVIDLYRAIPWVSLRHPFGRPNHGDPFVTATSRHVTLKLTTDRPLVVAINAQRTSVSAGGRVQTFLATNVRDLPINLAPDFRVRRGTIDGVEVLVFARPDRSSSALLDEARRSLHAIAGLLGAYPWPRFIVVATPGGYPMEGPGTIWIPPNVAPSNLRYIVAHETAHQWTPGLVGNDQWSDPFADEALADMVARATVGIHRASRCPAARLDRNITQYSADCYYEQIYIQGGNWLNDLRLRMGSAAYWSALRSYLGEHRFGLAGTRQLLDALDAATPVDIAALAAPLFPSRY